MPISLEINNTVADCDKGYIELCCAVNGELLSKIYTIQLKRFDGDDAFVVIEYDGLVENPKNVALVDTELANRSGVAVNSLINDTGLSYISIRIKSSVVNDQKDNGPYQCFLLGVDKENAATRNNSTLEMLNITEHSNILSRV